MGQYYNAVLNGKVYANYVDGSYEMAKLMEHSYMKNRYVLAIASKLFRKPGKLAWVGDYADTDDDNWRDEFKIRNDDNTPHITNLKWNGFMMDEYYLVNLTKKEYVDLDAYVKASSTEDLIINPLPLLTAVGNGKGGGDYCGNHEDMIGYWAYDDIVILPYEDLFDEKWNNTTKQYDESLKEKYTLFQNITNDVLFKEDR